MIDFEKYIDEIQLAMREIVVSSLYGPNGVNTFSVDQGLVQWCDLTNQVHLKNQQIFFFGNGASAAMALHMSADAIKNADLKAFCMSNLALLSAIGNDIHFDQSFSLPLKRFAVANDLLVTISSSGNSPNIINVIKEARDLGLKIVTLSGMSPQNSSRLLGDLNFYVPANRYGIIESVHQALLHAWLDFYILYRHEFKSVFSQESCQ